MKLFKKFLLSLLAFPISAFLVLITYLLIYFFLGEQIYIYEILRLTDINTLIKEFVIICFAVFIVILFFFIVTDIINNKNYRTSIRILCMLLLIACIAIIPIYIIKTFLNDQLFQLMFLIEWVTIIAAISLIYVIQDFINVWIINKKLKLNNLKNN